MVKPGDSVRVQGDDRIMHVVKIHKGREWPDKARCVWTVPGPELPDGKVTWLGHGWFDVRTLERMRW